jgi:glucokinase
MPVLAIDLGGTKLAAAVVDREGVVLSIRNTPVRKACFSETVNQIVEEAAAVVAASGFAWSQISRAGVIVPGIARAADGTAWAPNLWGDADVPLLRELSDRLPAPVTMDSDRAGYVLGEQWRGAARGLNDVVFVAVGTGIGAGIISGGRLIRGAGDIAGAVGWMALNPHFEDAYRAVGCWEAESAGPSVAHRAGRDSARSVASAARCGDKTCSRALDLAASYIAMGIANLISIFNPESVVLGGGLMQAGDLLLDPIRRDVGRWAHPRAAIQARIELSELGDRAGLFGAAKLAIDAS